MAADTFDVLRAVVAELKCKPGWQFSVVDEDGALRLRVLDRKCLDAYHPDDPQSRPLAHMFPVPTCTYNRASWERWVFECCRGVESHELGEWFRFGDRRPFAPMHGPGENPYVVAAVRSEEDARTTQDGSMRASMASQERE